MRMLKFWMVLSSIVLGMAIPLAEEIVAETIEKNIIDTKVVANQNVEGESEAVADVVLGDEEFEKKTEEAVPEELLAQQVAPLEQEASEVPAEKIENNESEVVVIEEQVDKEVEPISEDVEDKEIERIDTADLNDPNGNWLIKRFWFNKAEQLYGQIDQRVQHIFDLGSEFQEKSIELDQKLFDPFYLDIGIGRGELTELVNSLIEKLAQKDEISVERNKEEAEYLKRLEEENGTIEQLQADIEGVADIDSAVNNALSTFNERANLSRNYQSKAWHMLQEIAHELNDKKARELYFTIRSFARSVVDIEEYITSPFMQYFDELSNKADEQINRIKQEVAVLRQKGINLKEKVNELENAQQKEAFEEAAQQGFDTAQLEQQKREEKERGFFSSIGSMVQYMWNAFYSFLQKLFTPAKKETVKEEALDVAPTETEEVVEFQEQEETEQVKPTVEAKETELELASNAEQQEVMTAGAEEVVLIKETEPEEVAAPESSTPHTEAEEADRSEEVLEVQPAVADVQETIAPSAETESKQEQAQ